MVLVVEVVVESGPIVAAIRFRPEIEDFGLDNAVELRKIGEEALQDVPGCYGGQVGRVGCVGVDEGIGAVWSGDGRVYRQEGVWVNASGSLCRVREADTDWLGEEEHVGHLVPGVRIELGRQIRGDVARSELCIGSIFGSDQTHLMLKNRQLTLK